MGSFSRANRSGGTPAVPGGVVLAEEDQVAPGALAEVVGLGGAEGGVPEVGALPGSKLRFKRSVIGHHGRSICSETRGSSPGRMTWQ